MYVSVFAVRVDAVGRGGRPVIYPYALIMLGSGKVCLLPDIYPAVTVFDRFLDIYRVHSRLIYRFGTVIIALLHGVVVLFLEISSENRDGQA